MSSGAVGKDGKFTTSPITPEARRGMLTQDFLKSLDSVQKVAKGLPELLGQGDGIGSNSWVVSGDHTTTGKPLLANDPHLGATMPGIWTQVGLHCNSLSKSCPFDVSGFSFSGLPGVVIGHNNAISWGFTNLDPDVQDLYLERIDGNNVLYNNKWRAMATREETFKVAGQDKPVKITVRETRHGPLISDVGDDEREVGEMAAKQGEVPDGVRRRAAVDRAEPGPDRRRALRDQPGPELDRVPRRRAAVPGPLAEPRVRRHRRAHRLPGARD